MKKNKFFSIPNNATNFYIFMDKFEFYRIAGDYIKLSNGSSEKTKPLPIINSISKLFFSQIQNDSLVHSFHPDTHPDKNFSQLIRGVQESIKFEYAFNEFEPPSTLVTTSRLLNPLTIEIISLLYMTSNFAPGERKINSGLTSLMNIYGIGHKEIEDIRDERMAKQNFYIVGVSEGVYFSERGTSGYNRFFENEYSKPEQKTIATDPSNIFEIAWAELLFAEMFNMPVSICTFCGATFRLDEKNKQANYRRNNCGQEECKRLARSQMDHQRSITKRKALQLLSKGVDMEEVAEVTKARKKDISRWKKEYFDDFNSEKRKALKLLVKNISVSQVALELNVSIKTVSKWKKEYFG